MAVAHMIEPRAEHVLVKDRELVVILAGGDEIHAPLEEFPRLRDASPQDLADNRLIAGGIGIQWKSLDEDLSVAALARRFGRQRLA
ncbi:MAG: hypothetical protein Kow00122_07450 [Thermoleophilia bacterium]